MKRTPSDTLKTESSLYRLMSALLVLAAGTCCARAANVTFGTGVDQFAIDFVEIGNPGNAADTTGAPNPAGAVGYVYHIGKYEISEDMIDKANAAGALGITKDTRGPDKPATGISWFEAATFVNWLNTSSGGSAAYKFDSIGGTFALWDPMDAGYNAANPYRNSLATYWLPSADEWYKAAYFDPNTGLYFDYATGSNMEPTAVTGGTTTGTAVYNQESVTDPADITQAGGLSVYDTMGQGGNVWEWQETAFDLSNNDPGEARWLRGGSWDYGSLSLQSSTADGDFPPNAANSYGFRVAGGSVIPEPSRALLASMGGIGVLLRRRRPATLLGPGV